VVIGVPFLVAAIALPRAPRITGRTAAAALAGWLGLLIGLQIALAVGPGSAVLYAGLLLGAIPATALVLRVSGAVPWRSALAVLWFGAATLGLGLGLEAIRPAQHSAAAGTAVWIAAGLAMLAMIEPAADAASPAAGAASPAGGLSRLGVAVAVAVFGTIMIVGPGFDDGERGRLAQVFTRAAIALRDRLRLEPSDQANADARALQDQVPAGARIGFWGRSAAQLDFRRNPIRDVSWPAATDRRRDKYYLTPVERASLAALDYLIVDGVAPIVDADPWGSAAAPPVDEVLEHVKPVASSGATQLYRVRR
jgi:hypothetical protein